MPQAGDTRLGLLYQVVLVLVATLVLQQIAAGFWLKIPLWPLLGNLAVVVLACFLTHRSRVNSGPEHDAEFVLANAVGLQLVAAGFYIVALAEIAQHVHVGDLAGSPPQDVFRAFFVEGTAVYLTDERGWLPIVAALLSISILLATLSYQRMVSAEDAGNIKDGDAHPVMTPWIARLHYFSACLSFAVFLFIAYPWVRSSPIQPFWYDLLTLIALVVLQFVAGMIVSARLKWTGWGSRGEPPSLPTVDEKTLSPAQKEAFRAQRAAFLEGIGRRVRNSYGQAGLAATITLAIIAGVFWRQVVLLLAGIGLGSGVLLLVVLLVVLVLPAVITPVSDWLAERAKRAPPAREEPSGEGDGRSWRWIAALVVLLLLAAGAYHLRDFWPRPEEPTPPPQTVDAPTPPAPPQAEPDRCESLVFNVQFGLQSAVIDEAGRVEIAKAAQCHADADKARKQRENQTDLQVTVTGQADRRGSTALNQDLSLRRANAVRDALVDAGVPRTAIMDPVALGETSSPPPDDNPAFRRATIRIIAPEAVPTN